MEGESQLEVGEMQRGGPRSTWKVVSPPHLPRSVLANEHSEQYYIQ